MCNLKTAGSDGNRLFFIIHYMQKHPKNVPTCLPENLVHWSYNARRPAETYMEDLHIWIKLWLLRSAAS